MQGESRDEATGPLSFQQEELLRQIRQAPECAAMFDNVYVFALRGPVDTDCLAGAIEDVVRRHASLRTVIDEVAGEEVQRVRPDIGEVVRWTTGATGRETVADLLNERYGVSELSSGAPLFRAGIHRAGDALLLSFTVHHLVFDGWSEAVLWRDLSECYAARTEKREPVLPHLAGTYTGFARSQRETWKQLRQKVVPFWQRELTDISSVRWPSPDPPPPPSYRRVAERLELDAGTTERVRAMARTQRATPFVVLLAASAIAVSGVTGRHDLLLGSNVASREALNKMDMLGYFTNTRLTRARVDPGTRVSELVPSLRDYWLAGYEHRDAYIDPLLHALGRPPVVKVDMLDLPGYSGQDSADLTLAPTLPEAEVEVIETGGADLHWRELHFNWIPSDEGLYLELNYRPSKVSRKTVEQLRDSVSEIFANLS
jgi:hypothetical protein